MSLFLFPMRFRRLRHRALMLGIGTVIVLTICGCNTPPDLEPGKPVSVLTVELVSASQQQWPLSIPASGEVAAWQESIIGSELGGVRLDKLMVNVGDSVRKGQVLARFNEDSLRIELAQREAAVAEARVQAEKAGVDLARAEQLGAAEAMSKQAVQDARTQLIVAEARLAAMRAQRSAAALNLRRARVLAPDHGVISSRTATVGSVISVGTELFRLICGSRLEWRAQVRADALKLLQIGMPVVINDLDAKQIVGSLRQIAPVVSTDTGNALVYVTLPADSGLSAGMYLSGELSLGHRPALSLPESAVVVRDGNQYLMRVDSSGLVNEVKIHTGRRQGGAIEILDSLESSARFVRAGAAFLNDGDRVHVAVPSAAMP